MKIVSLFDGISCGYMAFQKCGITIDSYYAYEIDKNAIRVSSHNFPDIVQCGDVFNADFTVYKDVDYLIGGSPCNYWSLIRGCARETEAAGEGWDLFTEYVRAIKEIKPKFFIFENVASMSRDIEIAISEALGFPPICIDSALLTAQSRKRLYWVGKLVNDQYLPVAINQIMSRNVKFQDMIDDGVVVSERSRCVLSDAGSVSPKIALIKHRGNVVFNRARPGLTGYLVRVENGIIDIEGQYVRVPLSDGLYIARHLSVNECARLQSIPDTFKWPVSNSVAYKLIAKGWTVDVIVHLIKSTTI